MLTEEQLAKLEKYPGNIGDPNDVFRFLTGKYPHTARDEQAFINWNSETPDEKTAELKKRIPYDAGDVFGTIYRTWRWNEGFDEILNEINTVVMSKYDIKLKEYPRELEGTENTAKIRAAYLKKKYPNLDPTLDVDEIQELISEYVKGQKIELYEYLKKTITEGTLKALEEGSNKRVKH